MNEVRQILFGNASNSQIKHIIEQGGVKIDGVQLKTINDTLERNSWFVIQCGKRKFAKVVVKHTLSIKQILGLNESRARDVSDEVCHRPE